MSEILKNTRRVFFELSNRCNYAGLHPKCPASFVKSPRTLPETVVRTVLKIMSEEDFGGFVSFMVYCEAMTDPRLFMFLDLVNDTVPNATAYLLTNGWNLDAIMLRELISHGVKRLVVNGYSQAEYDRLMKLKTTEIEMEVRRKRPHGLDNRLKNYDKKDVCNPGQCSAPVGQIIIRHTGDVGLCCNDWDMRHTFGNLKEDPLEDILEKLEVKELYESLLNCERRLDICKGCQGGRI